MKILCVLLSLYGLIGFVVSLYIHILTFFVDDSLLYSYMFVFHVCIFPAFVILVYMTNKDKHKNTANLRKYISKYISPFFRKLANVMFFYTVINFLIFAKLSGDYPKHNIPLWLENRGFSGHWMLFYGAIFLGFLGLYNKIQKDG